MSAENPMELLVATAENRALAENIIRGSLETLLPSGDLENFCNFNAGQGELFLLEINKTAVGSMIVRPLPEKPQIWEIACIAVSPAWRRGGLGKFMVDKAEKFAGEKGASHLLAKLHTNLEAACMLFADYGFSSVKEEEPEGAFVVAKKL